MLGGLAFRVDDLAPDHGERLLHGGEAAGGAGAGDGESGEAEQLASSWRESVSSGAKTSKG